jgi:hypothetical protein
VANLSRFIIQNELPGPVTLNIEPEGVFHRLGHGEAVTVIDGFVAHPVTVRLSRSDEGEPIVSVWPGDGEVRVEKEGIDVLDLKLPEAARATRE